MDGQNNFDSKLNLQQPIQPQGVSQQPMMQQPTQLLKKTNILCIIALVLSIVMGPLGSIIGIVGLIDANKKKEKGKGLAITAMILGILIPIIIIIGIFGMLLSFFNGDSESAKELRKGCVSVDSNGNYMNESGTVVCRNYYCEYYDRYISLSANCRFLDLEDED